MRSNRRTYLRENTNRNAEGISVSIIQPAKDVATNDFNDTVDAGHDANEFRLLNLTSIVRGNEDGVVA